MRKFLRKSELYRTRFGTVNKPKTLDDKAKQEPAEEVTLSSIIKKYGIIPSDKLNMAAEPLFLDIRGEELTLTEKLKQKEQIDEYFKKLPAKVRKEFKDSTEFFYESINNTNLETMEKYGIFTTEHAKNIIEKRNEKNNEINKLNEQINNLVQQIENMKGNENDKQNNG